MEFSRFWDITLPLKEQMATWPGDTPFKRTVRQTPRGDNTWSNSEIAMGCHCGTHMDAPRHVFENGSDVNSFPLSTLVGECRVVEVPDEIIEKHHIERINPKFGERILFKTANSELFSDEKFHESFVVFGKDAAEILEQAQVVLIGTDGPSVDPYNAEEFPAHCIFCEAGIAVIENLYLGDVEPGNYNLICLPMKIAGSDGAPVRAILAR